MANQTSITLVNGGSFSDAGFSWHGTMNVTNGDLEFDFPLDYRIIATFMHLTILLLGVTGNIVVIVVARSAASLQSSTYCYLISLAAADLLVLISTVPEAIVCHHIGTRWLLGQTGCSLFIFTNFLGINAGSMSILAFTVDRYIAIISSPLNSKSCTLAKTRKTIYYLWLLTIIYCCPWLGLTEVKAPDPVEPERLQCEFRFSSDVNKYFFLSDLILFYIIPLGIAVFVYTRIAVVICRGSSCFCESSPSGTTSYRSDSVPENEAIMTESPPEKANTTFKLTKAGCKKKRSVPRAMRARTQILPMLIVVVVIFAVAWLPFRGLLIYNSLVEDPWLDIWYLLFAKTLIYINSAVNPLLYNAMSRRFRLAVRRWFGFKQRSMARKGPVNKAILMDQEPERPCNLLRLLESSDCSARVDPMLAQLFYPDSAATGH